MNATVCWGSIRNIGCILYPGAGTVVLIRPASTFYERIMFSVTRVRDLFHVGTTSRYYEDHGSYTLREVSYQNYNLLPLEEAMIKILESDDYDAMPPIDFLGDRFYGIRTIKAPVDEAAWFFELERLGECHPTWAVYRSAARFLRNPSKETLAEELEAIALAIGPELPGRKRLWYSQMPWPMAACLNMIPS